MNSEVSHYRMRLVDSLSEIGQANWDGLLQLQTKPNPFLSYAFLHALHESGSASTKTGWTPRFISIWNGQELMAAMPLYEKSHSYGEYVFDWAWANAYHQHDVAYYPKLLSAIPFTPIEGNRLLARDQQAQQALIRNLQAITQSGLYSSCHLLFPTEPEIGVLQQAGFMTRQGVQFHWQNQNFQDFEDFLMHLDQKKRKNIRAERRKVSQAGVQFQHLRGADITEQDWKFFKQCYDRTYAEHHSSPYLNLDFFLRIGQEMPKHLYLVIAILDGRRIAAALFIYDHQTIYGRYWGCLEHLPCLHFETAYYQALDFCISEKIQTFEGGAQGEHKLARGFLPHKTYSAHYLNEPAFANAVAHFLEREQGGIERYMDELNEHSPFK
ncbi:N-acetyltransferase [Undibacterium amnicola]|uniref:N-acetyltransferase n=1 Tax=Undibacterium amnicola TaxID=1834038 RepID=A0ABR6XNY8_9BURK|nr:GNAT family N-acetyltransferase [Undibacterium amnicola]MBC3831221.1 N-acetyltransferase [Undibacterium amnicola]